MRSAHGAGTADRMHDALLARAMKPPKNRKGPGVGPRASFEKSDDDSGEYGTADRCAQRHVARALAKASRLDRAADILLSIGRHGAAERLANEAFALREAMR